MKKSDLPEPLAGSESAVINGKIYVFGGSTNGSEAAFGTKQNSVHMYDTKSNTWTKKASMPTTRAGVSVAVVGIKIYVIGGYTNVNNKLTRLDVVEVYDTETDTWESRKPLSIARSWASAAMVKNKLYVFGGTDSNGVPLASVEIYDPTIESWTILTDMPTPLLSMGIAVMNDKIYLIGGWKYNNIVNNLRVFDTSTNSWSAESSMSTSRAALTAVTNNGLIYVLGGLTVKPNDGYSDKVEVYDPLNQSWTTNTGMTLTFPRQQSVSEIVDGNLYIIGGVADKQIIDSVEMFSLNAEEEPNQPQEPEQPKGDRAILVVTMTTGLEKEFDLSMDEVDAFITWYENKQAGTGTASYAIDKHNNNKGPFSSRKDYVIYDKILTFEVNEYSLR